MKQRQPGVALALLAALVLFGPLAHASPADPTWIGGLWDDADFDEVVNHVTSALSTVEPMCSTQARPWWLYVSPAAAETETLSSIRLRSPDSRAPPLNLA